MKDKEKPKATVRISDGKGKIYNYRQDLWEAGFQFNKRSKGNSFYEKEVYEKCTSEWETYCKERGLSCTIIPPGYTRSTDYRKTFFASNKPAVEAKYRCAYCGHKLIYKDVTVDHIFPVNGLSYSPEIRKRAARFGITSANEEKNLCAACRVCNSRKGTKTGLWIIRGFLGKSNTLWKIRIAARTVFIVGLCLVAVFLFAENTNMFHISNVLNAWRFK